MVFKRKKKIIPPADPAPQDYGSDIAPLPSLEGEIKPIAQQAPNVGRGRHKTEELQAPVPDEYVEEPFTDTRYVNGQTLDEVTSLVSSQFQNATQLLDETRANLKWLMEDNQAKASAMKVTMMNLDSLQHDLNVVTSKFLSMTKEMEDAAKE